MMMFTNNIYNKIIKEISESVKYHLNEMARKPVNRTIDKKLWLTVSSIISRNRATEAEDVKPIGNDKDNLLQRYVAALLIMKKPCPTDIEDIGKLKTFKKIGYKFIDLGGTIQDILKLYNENSGTNNSKKQSEVTKPEVKPKLLNDISSQEDDDDFWSDFGKNTDDDEYTGFFSDINDLSLEDKVHNLLEKDIYQVTYKTDIKLILNKAENIQDIPSCLKLIKPKDNKDFQKLYYITDKKHYLHDEQSSKPMGKFKGLLKAHNWKIYVNPCLPTIMHYSSLYPINLADFDNANDIVTYIKETYENVTNQNILEEAVNSSIINTSITPDTWVEYLTEYNLFINSIDNETVKHYFKNDAMIDYIMLSPDNCFVFIAKYKPEITKIFQPHEKRYTWSRNWGNTATRRFGLIGFINSTEYIVEFTGSGNFYDIESEHLDNPNSYKDNQKQFKRMKLLFTIFNNDISQIYFRDLNKMYNEFGTYSISYFKKLNNGSYGVVAQARPYINDNTDIINRTWGSYDKRKNVRSRTRNKYKEYSTFTCRPITDDGGPDSIPGYRIEPNCIAYIRDIDNMMILKLFKQVGTNPALLSLELLPKGYNKFKELAQNKGIEI